MRCTGMEDKLIEYLDGRAKPAERRAVEEHLSACADCRIRAEEFRMLWSALDDLPVLSPSPAFDASLRARIAAEPARRGFWNWLPSPRLAFAVTALVAMSVWLVFHAARRDRSRNRLQTAQPVTQVTAEADFRMIRDLPVLENYDVLSKFDALSELAGIAGCRDGRQGRKKPGNEAAIPIRRCSGRLADGGPDCVRLRSGKSSARLRRQPRSNAAQQRQLKREQQHAAERSECRASRPIRNPGAKHEQSAAEGHRAAPGYASGQAGEIPAE